MPKRSFKGFVEQELGTFPHFLIYAVLEWVLILVLFIDGFLAFFANEFAKFFELKIPCLLCTRIEHVLVHRDADFYYNESLCESHKMDVSSLAYCHVHKKLSDIKKMCEGCLLSFATQKESDCDTYKSLAGVLHKDIELFVDDDSEMHLPLPSGRKDDAVQAEKGSLNRCSCCGEPLKVKSHPKKKNHSLVSQAPTPSPRASFVNLRNEGQRNLGLPYIRYTGLKLSDNEPEFQDEEDGPNVPQLDKQLREEIKAAAAPLLAEAEAVNGDRTPIARGNKFFGIPLTDSANSSPRWNTRLPRKSPLERVEFASESTGGNMSNEADGDSILRHLKRQVHLDRKSLMALYMELDEERSASAVAANNAMAMITRLQAEKAAVRMEALQYQRMMEEQAEYDQEALQATKDLLIKREAELEVYRGKYGVLDEELFMGSRDEVDDDYQEIKSQSHSSYTEKSECVSPSYSLTEAQMNGENMQNEDHQPLSLCGESGGGTRDISEKSSLKEKSGFPGGLKNLGKGSSSQSSTENNTEEESEQKSKMRIVKDLSRLNERVNALRVKGRFLEDADNTLQKGSERGRILTEISDNIQKLCKFVTTPFEDE